MSYFVTDDYGAVIKFIFVLFMKDVRFVFSFIIGINGGGVRGGRCLLFRNFLINSILEMLFCG